MGPVNNANAEASPRGVSGVPRPKAPSVAVVDVPQPTEEKQKAALKHVAAAAQDSSIRKQAQSDQPAVKRPKNAGASEAAPKAPSAPSGACPTGNDAVVFQQTNPKRAGTGSATRYAQYSKAKTVNEALRLGAVKGDIPNDFNKGYLKRA